MSREVFSRLAVLLLVVVACVAWTPMAWAIKPFNDQFIEHYIGEKKDTAFAKEVLGAKCWLCHQGRKSRKNHNAYGEELAKLLDKRTDARDTEKIVAALVEVEKIHLEPENEESPTYGDLIKAGKLPGGSVEEARKEPQEKEEKEKA